MPSAVAQFFRKTDLALALSGEYIAGLVLRLFLAWEFGESGIGMFLGGNWFIDIQHSFPFPFNHIPANINWFLATWIELLGATLLILGLWTRYAGMLLLVLTLVAWYSVHAGYGYNVCGNGYKLPLIYCVALIPLITNGAGRLSLDHWLSRRK